MIHDKEIRIPVKNKLKPGQKIEIHGKIIDNKGTVEIESITIVDGPIKILKKLPPENEGNSLWSDNEK